MKSLKIIATVKDKSGTRRSETQRNEYLGTSKSNHDFALAFVVIATVLTVLIAIEYLTSSEKLSSTFGPKSDQERAAPFHGGAARPFRSK